MDGPTLFDKLLRKRGLNPTSLAASIKRPTAQSGFDRFRKGLIKQPKRSEQLELAAKRLGIDVLAFYDGQLADVEWARIDGSASESLVEQVPGPERSAMSDYRQRVHASFSAQGLMVTIGARLALVEDGEVHIEMPFSAALSQQHGYLHAGATTSIVDSACGYAALTKAPVGFEVVTAEFKLNLLRPALGQRFLALGRVVNAGRLLSVCTGEVRAFQDGEEAFKVVALMQATIVNVSAETRPR